MRRALILLAVLAAALGAWFLLRPEERPSPAPPPAPPGPAAAPAPPPPSPAPAAPAPAPAGSAAIEVLVVDLRGHPLSGATVRVHGPGRPISNPDMTSLQMDPPAPRAVVGEGTVDREGRFVSGGLVPGTYWARASAPGFATATTVAVLREAAKPVSVRLLLERACALEGMVRRAGGGSVEGWTVAARRSAGWSTLAFDRVEAPCGADGRWRIEGLAPGRFEILVRPSMGLLVAAGAVEVPGVRVYDILIHEGAALRGRVLDAATGDPVRGADVLLSLHGGGAFGQSFARGLSGADGVYELAGLPPGTDGWLRVRKEGYLPSFVEGSDPSARIDGLEDGGVFERDVRLARGGRVAGRAADGEGKPVEGAYVCVESWTSRGIQRSPVVATGPDGAFLVDPVVPGPGVLLAGKDGFLQRDVGEASGWDLVREKRVPSSASVDIAAGETARKDLVLEASPRGGGRDGPAPASLAGRVRSDDGSPLVGLRVRVLPDNSNSPYWSLQTGTAVPAGEDGTFRAGGLAPGPTAVAAQAEGRALVVGPQVELVAGQASEGYEIVLPPALALAGRVQDRSGDPVEGAGITLDRIAEEHFVAVTGADGAFRVDGLAPGSWTVSAHAPGREPASATAASGTEDLVLVVGGTEGLSGTVVDAETGAPLAGIDVTDETLMMESMRSARLRNGRVPRNSAQTDRQGKFRIPAAEEGVQEIVVGAGGRNSRGAGDYVPARVSVDPAKGPVRIALHRGPSIAGRVVDAKGEPLRRVIPFSVEGESDPGWEPFVETVHQDTAMDGTFRIEGLPAGTFDLVFFEDPGEEDAEFPPLVVRGVRSGTVDLVVRASPGVAIEGRVVDEQGHPPGVPGHVVPVPVGAGPGLTPWDGVAVGEDGRFRTKPVPAGTAVEIMAEGFRGFATVRSGEVMPGATDILVRIRRGGTIAGRVVDEAGLAVPEGVPLAAWRKDAAHGFLEGIADCRTGPDGTFLLEGLPEGVFQIHAGGEGSEFVPAEPLDGVKPGTKDLVIRLARGLVLSGKIVGESEFPFLLAVQGNHRYAVELAKDGTFTLRGLEKGKVVFSDPSGDRVLGEFEAPATGIEVHLR